MKVHTLPDACHPDESAEYALSHGQRALWYVYRSAPDSSAYNVSYAWRVHCTTGVDSRLLRRVLAMLVGRHPALRTTYFTGPDGEPRQRVAVAAALDFEEIDASAWDESRIRSWIADEAHRPFDLERGPVLRARLLRTSQASPVLLLALHHIAVDGWSLYVLLEEMDHLYAQEAGRVKTGLRPADPLDFLKYVRFQDQLLQSPEKQRLLTYWEHQLSGDLPTLALPTDFPRGKPSTSGAQCTFEVGPPCSERLRSIVGKHGTTLSVLLLSAFQVLLSRYTGQDDLVVGTPMSGRRRADTRDTFGYLVNPVCMKASLGGNPSFAACLQENHRSTRAARDHEDLPLLLLAERLKVGRVAEQPFLFQTLFTFVDRRLTSTVLHRDGEPLLTPRTALEMSTFAFEQRSTQFDLVLIAGELDDAIACEFRYRSDLFRPDTMARMAGHFTTLLEGIASDPAQRVGQLPMLTELERHQVLTVWNETATPSLPDAPIHRLIEAQAARSPHAIAVGFGDQSITYDQLNRRANRLARYLRELGVGPDRIVGVCSRRSIENVIAILALLKAGGAYLPLDPGQPEERLSEIVGDARCHLILVEERLHRSVQSWSGVRLVTLDDAIDTSSRSDEDLDGGAQADDLAYVIYTSGSTGRPKGVMVVHRAIGNQLHWRQSIHALGPRDSVLHALPVSFDPSIWELFGPLIAGARLVLARSDGHQEPSYLAELIRHEGITTLQVTPRLLELLLDEPGFGAASGLRQVYCGGEPLSAQLRARFLQSLSATLTHLYGPTETAIDATFWECCRDAAQLDDGRITPIGYPIANARAYVLDRREQPVPIGQPGELYIGGRGLARGYLGDPELTQQKFLPDAFSTGDRMYRTGDIVRRRADGALEFIGREDQQVKIHGFRVELSEVEAAVAQYPGIAACAVAVHQGRLGVPRLVAYLEPAESVVLAIQPIVDFMRARLPYYMCPADLVAVPRLPRLPSGKVNRAALAEQSRADWQATRHHIAPRNNSELALARIWEDLLAVRGVGVTDDFFGLGGHSLLAIRLLARLERDLDLAVPLRRFLQDPTIAGLIRAMQADDDSPLVAIKPDGKSPPLFCVAAGHGDQMLLRRLAKRLGADQPFFALVPPAKRLKGPRAQRTSTLVGLYQRAIESARSDGPFWVGGYSAGGVLAVELARDLRSRGKLVLGVILLDTQYPLALPLVLAGLRVGQWSLSRIARDHESDRLATLRALFNDAGFATTIHALLGYHPRGADVPVALFLARSSPMRWSHTRLQWRRLLGGNLTIHYIDGGHFSAFDERHSRGAAAALAAYLRTATGATRG